MKIKNEANETVKAGCVVLDKDGRLLTVTTPKRTHLGFPKGHAELGEMAEQVAVRETLEETGYKVKIIKQLPDLAYKHGETDEMIRVNMFLAEPLDQALDSEETPVWITREEAKDRMYPNLVEYLDQIGL